MLPIHFVEIIPRHRFVRNPSRNVPPRSVRRAFVLVDAERSTQFVPSRLHHRREQPVFLQRVVRRQPGPRAVVALGEERSLARARVRHRPILAEREDARERAVAPRGVARADAIARGRARRPDGELRTADLTAGRAPRRHLRARHARVRNRAAMCAQRTLPTVVGTGRGGTRARVRLKTRETI